MKYIFLLLVPLLSACTAYQYSKPVCDSSNQVDVPGLEGTYTAYSEEEAEHYYRYHEDSAVMTRHDRGAYQLTTSDGAQQLATCLVNGRIVSDSGVSYQPPGPHAPAVSGLAANEITSTAAALEMTQLIFDPKEFGASIPYTLVDNMVFCMEILPFNLSNVLSGISAKGFRHDCTPVVEKYLSIDNSNVAPEKLLQFGKPQLLSVRLYRKESK